MVIKQRASLLDERELIDDQLLDADKQIKQLQETIDSLARLCNVGLAAQRLMPINFIEPDTRMGLADAVRKVVKAASSPLIAVEVRDALIAGGFDASEYSNLLASVHTTLKRLGQSGELLQVDKDGKTAYKNNPEYKAPALRRLVSPLPEAQQGSGLLGRRFGQVKPDISERMGTKEKK
jgi:hypothetical protein